MKKYLMLALCVLTFCLTSCNRIDEELMTTTLVHVFKSVAGYPKLETINCYNDKGEWIGGGKLFGDYQVPKRGSIAIQWTYNEENYSATFSVGDAVELWIKVYNTEAETWTPEYIDAW